MSIENHVRTFDEAGAFSKIRSEFEMCIFCCGHC